MNTKPMKNTSNEIPTSATSRHRTHKNWSATKKSNVELLQKKITKRTFLHKNWADIKKALGHGQ